MKEDGKKIILRDLDAYDIQQYQQNRYPCLFLDYVTEVVPGEYAKGYKNYSYNEWFFPNHFPDEPNVPGFIQVETLAQMFLMTFLTIPENKGKKTAFVSIDKMIFKKKIIPGMRLDIESVLDRYKRGIARGKSVGYIDGEMCCSANIVVAIPDVINQYKPVSK